MMQDADLDDRAAARRSARSASASPSTTSAQAGRRCPGCASCPVDALKIPKEFLGGLGASEKDWEFARAIVTLGHSLRLGVIAEGIEYADQVDRLREIGVDSGQGFYFSPPVEAASIPDAAQHRGQGPRGGTAVEASAPKQRQLRSPARRLPASSVGSRPPALNVPCGGGRSRPGRPCLLSSWGQNTSHA